MSIRPVLRLGDPALRQRASEVPESWFGSEDLKTLINDLLDTKTARSEQDWPPRRSMHPGVWWWWAWPTIPAIPMQLRCRSG